MKHATIILGHSAGKHGISLRQRLRLDAALHLRKTKQSDYLIPTGGFGIFNRSGVSLAEKCKQYLVAHGAQPKNILLVDSSRNTREDAVQALKIMEKYRLESATVVTSIDHMSRARRIFYEIFPRSISLTFHVSDYWAGWGSLLDAIWHTAGWIKYVTKKLLKPPY